MVDGEESQYQGWNVCTLSHICSYSLPGRWTLLKLDPHVTLPHWDFMQDRHRTPEVNSGVTLRGDTLDSGSKVQELSLRARWAHPMHNAGDTGILPFSSPNYLFI